MEAFTRVQEGLCAEGDDWVTFVYGVDEKLTRNECGEIQVGILTEVPQLYQYKQWLRLMASD